jgi:hypothetical protein
MLEKNGGNKDLLSSLAYVEKSKRSSFFWQFKKYKSKYAPYKDY